MPDYNDLKEVTELLDCAQSSESDNRERAREVRDFIEKDDGQWEPDIINNMSGRPRYTFDKCNPIVDSIAGEMEQAEFSIKIRPASFDATNENADLIAGLVRNIEAMSGAVDIYDSAARKMVKCGFDAWLIKHDYCDVDSFEQDIFIKRISNAIDRVWFDENSEEPDASDAMHGFLLHTMTHKKYEEKYPDGSKMSVSNARTKEVYVYKPNFVVIGQMFYIKETMRELALLSNNEVVEVGSDFRDKLAMYSQQGINLVRTRERPKKVAHSRFFDGNDWLTPDKETVFSYIPIIPMYGNFDIAEDKIIYRGAINKLMDAQRVYNYAQSRAVEEGALAPREKHWMTSEQAAGHEAKLRTFNTNADPVQLYNHVADQPQPYKTGGPSVNQGLQITSSDMKQNIVEGSGIFAANQGNAPASHSGIAIELQQNKGDNSTIKYFKARKRAIKHTGVVIVDALPRVYDTERTKRIIGEDGSAKMVNINELDIETKSFKNNIRVGKYDVICDVGPAFQNRQQETKQAFIDVSAIDPTIIQQGKDVFLNSLGLPGMELIAERARKQMFEAGLIPDNQMTDEEKERARAMIAKAEAERAAQGQDPMTQAMQQQTMAQVMDTKSRVDERLANINLKQRKQELDEAKFNQQVQNDSIRLIMEQNAAIVENLNKQADTLKTIREAMGKISIIGPGLVENMKEQSEIIGQQQENQA